MAFNLPREQLEKVSPEELRKLFGNNVPPSLNHNSQQQALQNMQQLQPSNNNPFSGLSSNGEATLMGMKFVLNGNSVLVDGILINSPRIVIKDGSTLMYWDVDSKTYKPLAGSQVLQVINDSVKQAKEPVIPLNNVDKTAMNNETIKSVQQLLPKDIDQSTSQFVKPQFKDEDHVTLFQSPVSVLLLVGFGWMVYNSYNKK